MPLYEYHCEDCGLNFEVRQKFSDEPINVCQKCGGQAKKLVSRGAFTLKGGGWYQQGYSQKSSCPTPAVATSEACASCPKAANA
ncbi:MAG: zinc ribbon domain-containing protein [Deltaproteobacteria bacterium]|jgi:putative FmdB family regulatory protein|nr:zinc ribbon domain-containing protein [Deltaproteobacteria bacterium]MCW8892639.1 zinc ribbon domain-containing protein [Deltaproteobacteria bacterium]